MEEGDPDSIREECKKTVWTADQKPMEQDEKIETISARGILVPAKSSSFKKIPLLEAVIAERVPQKKDTNGVLCIDLDPNVLKSCISYAESEFQSPGVLLTKLSTSSTVSELLSTADYLMIDVQTISTQEELQTLERRLKDVKSETWARVARHTYEPSGDIPDRLGARDAAATLCFTLSKGTLNCRDNLIKNKVTNDVLFIVSHAKTFGPRTRTHVWNVFKNVVALTSKQKKQFENWVSKTGLAFDFYNRSDSDSENTDGDCSDGCIEYGYDEDLDDYYGGYSS